jgi:hypothetical protein
MLVGDIRVSSATESAQAHAHDAGTGIAEHMHPSKQKSHFWRHYVEMIVAMMIGMAVLGFPSRAILSSFGYTWPQAVARLTEVVCVVMTFNMAVAMVAWMRVRGHDWRASLEMTGAMYAATAVALCMFWLHLVSADPTIGVMHILMLPAMLALMLYRKEEYSSHSMHIM